MPDSMAQEAHAKTLFHLIPLNQEAEDALQHPDNRRFVSVSSTPGRTPGLEIGFHIPPFSRGHVIARLGRNTDLILRNSYSAVHVAFEIHPETLVVMLSVRTKGTASVAVAPASEVEDDEGRGQGISGDCAIIYGQRYNITIASYRFGLAWRQITSNGSQNAMSLKELATNGYRESMERLKDVRSRDRSLAEPSTPASWYMTRLQSAKAPLVDEADVSLRICLGEGSFGKVYKTVDRMTGNYFAVKVVDLRGPNVINPDLSRAALHREIKILESLSHENIIECLGTKDFDTDLPLIFMPCRPGSLHSLVEARPLSDELCKQVLKEMLCALDYLAFRNICHRDVKPQNILYEVLDKDNGTYRFQLGDFGLANVCHFAETLCGTPFYQAPEVRERKPQTPKVDVWSLFVTFAVIAPHIDFPPRGLKRYEDFERAVQAAAACEPLLKPMARINPAHRASAAQMLVKLFGGAGLTTPKSSVPEIAPNYPKFETAMMPPEPSFPQLVEYSRRNRQTGRPSRPPPRPGILPNRIPMHQPPELPLVRRLNILRDHVKKPSSSRAVTPPKEQQQSQRFLKRQPPQRRPGDKPAPPLQHQQLEGAPLKKGEQNTPPKPLPAPKEPVVQGSILTPRLPGAFPEAQTILSGASKS